MVKINKVYVFPAVLQEKPLMKGLLLLESLSTLIFGLQIRRDEEFLSGIFCIQSIY